MTIENVKEKLRDVEKDYEKLRDNLNKVEKNSEILRERVHSLKSELYALAIFFVGIAGVGGYFLSKVPDEKKLTENIATAQEKAVQDAQKKISDYANTEFLDYSGDSAKGCARIKDLQMCWGKTTSRYRDPVFRLFEFSFQKPFAETPTIAEAIDGYNPTNEGYAFSVYSSSPSPTGCSGGLLRIRADTEANAEAIVSYIAIGKWR